MSLHLEEAIRRLEQRVLCLEQRLDGVDVEVTALGKDIVLVAEGLAREGLPTAEMACWDGDEPQERLL